jgi:hypothetical protein
VEAVAVSDSSFGKGDRALAGASAPAAPFPRLEEDKCNRKHSRKGRYSAEMNILGYINEHGENNVAELVVTVADCLSSKEFQKKWHSFLTGFLKRRFPSGMWTRERQPRSGNWHAHCVVNLGRDIKTGFPIAEVESGNYRNVQLWIRALWKELREAAERYGVGRISLLPIKKTGPAARKVFCQICGEVARQCEIGWRRTLPAFRHLGHETVVLFEILLGEQSDFPEAANVVREPSGIGGCRNDTQIVGRRLVVSVARAFAPCCAAGALLSGLGLGIGVVRVG